MALVLKHNGAAESLYEHDFHQWALEQARAILARRWNEVDAEHVAEEVEELSLTLRRKLQSDLEVLLAHLLKWAYQPKKQSASWEASIDEHRDRVKELLQDNPSLAQHLHERFGRAYGYARRHAAKDMKLRRERWKALSQECPWTLEQVLDPEFYPSSASEKP